MANKIVKGKCSNELYYISLNHQFDYVYVASICNAEQLLTKYLL